jgi:hypothetical protein
MADFTAPSLEYPPRRSLEGLNADTKEKEGFLPSIQRPPPKQNRVRKGVIAIIVFVVSITATATTTYHLTKPQPLLIGHLLDNSNDKYKGQWTNCGNTIDEALARNCKFDMMGNNWVPPLCHDSHFAEDAATGNESFAALFGENQFLWSANVDMSEPLDDLEGYLAAKAHRGEEEEPTAYTTESWHIAHCMYWYSVGTNAINRLNAGERDVWVPRVVRKPEHARHCTTIVGDKFIRNPTVKVPPALAFFGFATCVQLA